MKVGATELLVIFVVALIAIGPDKLPSFARKLGKALALFRKTMEEATKDIRENVTEPLEEAQKPLRDAVEPIRQTDQAVRSSVKEMQDSLNGIGRPKPPKQSAEVKTADVPAESAAAPDPVKTEEEMET